jgi:hypothetical protein
MSTFSDIDAFFNKNLYQGFMVEMGIEKIEVFIPKKTADNFYEKIMEVRPNSADQLRQLVNEYKGLME